MIRGRLFIIVTSPDLGSGIASYLKKATELQAESLAAPLEESFRL